MNQKFTSPLFLQEYFNYQVSLTRRYGRIIALITFPVLCFLLYMDLVILKLPPSILLIRGIPLVICIVYLIVINSPLKEIPLLSVGGHFLFLITGMAMMCALSFITFGTAQFNGAVLGMVVIIFGILIGSPFGALYLAPIYLLPLTVFMTALQLHHGFNPEILPVLINPIISITASLVLGEVQNRGRKKAFEARQTITLQNHIIAESNNKMQEDLELARRLQHDLIPQAPPESEKFEIYTFYLPMQEVGGDFFDFITFDEDERTGILIGDVSGHGVHAALITSMIKMLVETSRPHQKSPEKLFRYINEKLYGKTGENFFTAFYAIYNPEDRILTYARGGHVYPILIRDGGRELIPLKGRGNMLGAFQNLSFEECDLELQRGDRILFYTDGLTEARNPDGRDFEDDLPGILARNAALPVNRLIPLLYRELMDFAEKKEFLDDICMVGLEIIE